MSDEFWHHAGVKSLALEDIYTDPHRLDAFLDSGESVRLVRGGRTIAELVPRQPATKPTAIAKLPSTDYRLRFLETWGSEAFRSGISAAQEVADFRRDRVL